MIQDLYSAMESEDTEALDALCMLNALHAVCTH